MPRGEPESVPPTSAAASNGHGLRLTPTAIPDAGTSIGERIAFGLAIVVAPLGLLTCVIAAAISARRRGWVPSLVSAGIVVGAVLTLLIAGGLGVGDTYAARAIEHRATQARSQPLCRVITATGVDATGADFGWPTPGESIDSSVASIRAFADRWSAVREVAPPGVRAGAAEIAAAATDIAAGIDQSRSISDAANTSRLEAIRSQSPVPGWVDEYCG